MTRAIKHLHLRFALATAFGLLWAGMLGAIESEPEASSSTDSSCAVAATDRAATTVC